jgi:hypothetical protein
MTSRSWVWKLGGGRATVLRVGVLYASNGPEHQQFLRVKVLLTAQCLWGTHDGLGPGGTTARVPALTALLG